VLEILKSVEHSTKSKTKKHRARSTRLMAADPDHLSHAWDFEHVFVFVCLETGLIRLVNSGLPLEDG